MNSVQRCPWADSDPLMRSYHDQEWGFPERNSRALWEKLMLDGFQAGLSWITILRKREAFREAFANFDPQVVARFGKRDVTRLLKNPAIVRSRAKIEATISNARAYLEIDDFSKFVWAFANHEPIRNVRPNMDAVPAETPLSKEISIALKQRGFKFVGPVIVYAWMQATGIVNDHVAGCFRLDAGNTAPAPEPRA